MKNRPADYEDQLDKKEAYKSSLLRKDDQGSETRIGRLEQMGSSFTSNETQQMINNIAQICHTLITGGGAGEFSGIKLSNDQLPYIEKIADIVVKMHKGSEDSESQVSEPEINSKIEGILNRPKTNVNPQAGQPYQHQG